MGVLFVLVITTEGSYSVVELYMQLNSLATCTLNGWAGIISHS